MDLGGVDAVGAAFDALTVQYEHLLKLVEDGGLEGYDNTWFVAYLQGFERFRNRLSLADHRGVKDAQRRDLANELCHSARPASDAGGRVEEPDDRTYGQRMHDALEQLCDRILRTDEAAPDAGRVGRRRR